MISDTIQHHGVKGMKWGQRKKTESSGSNDGHKSHKKAIAIGATALGLAAGVGAYKLGVKSGKIDSGEFTYQMRTLLKNPMSQTIKAGSTVTRANKGKMFLNSNRTYFTNKISDHKKYLTDDSGTNSGRNSDNRMYSVLLKAKSNVKIPSQQTQTREFMKYLKNNPDAVSKSIAEHYVGKGGSKKQIDDAASKFSKQIASSSKAYQSTKIYNKFLDSLTEGSSQGRAATKARNEFWNQLEKKGYSGVVDQVDKRSGFTKNPLIAFNGIKSFSILSQTPLSEARNKYNI